MDEVTRLVRARLRNENPQIDECPDPDAAFELCNLISEISEQCWHAGWLMGVEDALWDVLAGGDRRYGHGQVSEEQIERLRRLSSSCDGWWHFRDDERDEVFVRLADWVPLPRRD